MLNQEMDSVLLVKGWKKGANWSFPRGKINKNESDLDCAIREVYEETGFDIKEAGLASEQQDEQKSIEITMREQHMRLYVFRGAPMDFDYAPRTRKEISRIQWYKLSELPTLKKGKAHQDAQTDDLASNANKYYMVAPFLGHLKKWIGQQKKADKSKMTSTSSAGQLQNDAGAPENGYESLDVDVGPDHEAANMDRLLAGLRQSEQTVKAPVPSIIQNDTTSPGSGDLMDLPDLTLEANGHHAMPSQIEQSGTAQYETLVEQKATSNDLLALLRGGPPSRPELPPETPADQLLQNPLDPPSPKLEHQQAHPHRPLVGPRPQAFPIFPSSTGYTTPPRRPEFHVAPSLPHVNQLTKPNYRGPSPMQTAPFYGPVMPASQAPNQSSKEITSISGPGQMQAPLSQRIPDNVSHQEQTSPFNMPMPGGPAAPQPGARAPYQRTGDPDFARQSENSMTEPRIIPPASKLPPPKLTSHTFSLLSLFKSPAPPLELSSAAPTHSTKLVPTGDFIPKVPSLDHGKSQAMPHVDGSKRREQGVSHYVEEQKLDSQIAKPEHHYPETSLHITPPQILKSVPPPSNKPNEISGTAPLKVERTSETTVTTKPRMQPPTSAHQNALLDLFRKPSATETAAKPTPSGPPPASLQLPSSSFELSALPNTPGHSREPSALGFSPKAKEEHATRASPTQSNVTLSKHPQILRRPAHSTSATVDGPLNIPQFELIHHAKEVQSSKTRKKRQNQHAPQKAPITILQRPSSKGVDRPSLKPPPHSPVPNGDTTPKQLPSRKPPETPRLHAKPSAPEKRAQALQPQILRRPVQQAADQDLAAPSPVSPLPSPKHPVLLTRQGKDRTTPQHKQSLLAMFSRPGPASGPGSSPVSEQPSSTSNEVISPLLSRQRDQPSLGTTDLPKSKLRMSSTASANSRGSKSLLTSSDNETAIGGSSSGDGRATPRGVTHTDRNFLLNFLGDVARSGK